jgi:hypothetical protein
MAVGSRFTGLAQSSIPASVLRGCRNVIGAASIPPEAPRGMKDQLMISQEARGRINESVSQKSRQRTEQFATEKRQLDYYRFQVCWPYLFSVHVSYSSGCSQLCCVFL